MKNLILIILIVIFTNNYSFSQENIEIYESNYGGFNDLFIKCFKNIFKVEKDILVSRDNSEKIQLFLRKDNNLWLITWSEKEQHLPTANGVFHYYQIINNKNNLVCEKYVNDVDGLTCLMQYAFFIDLIGSNKCVGQTLFIGNSYYKK